MNEGIYNDLGEDGYTKKNIKRRSDLRNIYIQFFNDFKDYLVAFTKESLSELVIGEIPVSIKPITLFNDDRSGRYITVKNQGEIECFISTNGTGGFRLDRGEKERFWVNKTVRATTISGSTTLGIIQS